MKTALITGITGQDGMYLAELLHEKKYKVYGLIRGQQNPKRIEFEKQFPYVELVEGDLLDSGSLIRAIAQTQPDEVYNLGAISFVKYSFENPEVTSEITGLGVMRLLEAIRANGGEKSIRFYQASTSEMYGGVGYNMPKAGYVEESVFHPRSPYGVAKLYGHWITRNYRENYDMHASCGILFNHESPRRGLEFVTRKATDAVARIKLGMAESEAFGYLDAKRDWGFAGDYVEGMWRVLQQDEPDDFVLATGETHSIRELFDVAFAHIGIDDWKPYITQDERFMRPSEVEVLLGDPTKAKKVLGWEPKISFEKMIQMMVDSDIKNYKETGRNS